MFFEWSPPTDILFRLYLAFYLAYCTAWHFIWHILWHIFWHAIWHLIVQCIWKLIWHSTWHIPWHNAHSFCIYSIILFDGWFVILSRLHFDISFDLSSPNILSGIVFGREGPRVLARPEALQAGIVFGSGRAQEAGELWRWCAIAMILETWQGRTGGGWEGSGAGGTGCILKT